MARLHAFCEWLGARRSWEAALPRRAERAQSVLCCVNGRAERVWESPLGRWAYGSRMVKHVCFALALTLVSRSPPRRMCCKLLELIRHGLAHPLEHLHELGGKARILGRQQRDRAALGASAARPADAMHVRFAAGRSVKVDDRTHILDVKATLRHV